MPRRRGRGEGSIRERADGRWEVRIDIGRGPDRKRRRKSAFAATQGQAVKLLKQLAGRQVNGELSSTSTPTMARFLENWYELHLEEWRPSTRRCYRRAIDGFLVPAFGTMRLEQISPTAITSWLLEHKKAHGARRRITLAHATLRSALSYAEGQEMISRNPAAVVKVPKPTKRKIQPLSFDQARTFLTAASKHRLGALFSVAISCGLRLGEATGLRWEDVDLTTGELHVRQQLQKDGKRLVLQQPKTQKSRRTLALPQMCLDVLKTHRSNSLKTA